jgi:hypothetical protein
MKTNQEHNASLPIKGEFTLAYALSLVVALIMTVASVAGLLYQTRIYPAEELRLAFVPNDVVNLVIGVPILLGSMWLTRRGKLIGLLFWPGALFYVLYNYLVYILGMPLNVVFLLYLILVTLSAYTMIGLVASIDGEAVQEQLGGVVPERVAGGVLVGFGTLFFLRVVVVIIDALISQIAVAEVELALLITDFLFVPAWVIGGVLLWRRKALGYVAATGLLFQSSMLFIGLVLFMLLQPLLTDSPLKVIDVVVVFIMGSISFIPLALFVRGAASDRSSRST